MTDKPLLNNNFIESIESVHKRHLLGCAQKAEKIWAATVLVTDIMRSENLPQQMLGAVSSTHGDLYEMTRRGPSENTLESVLSRLDELMSLIRIGVLTEELSSMNAGILGKEIGLLSEQIRRIYVLVKTKNSRSTLFAQDTLPDSAPKLDPNLFHSEFFDSSRFGDLLPDKMQSHPFERLITAPMQSKDVGISKGQDKTTIIDNQNDILKDKAKIQNDNKGHTTNNKQQQEISIRNKDISEAKVTRKEEVLRIIQVRKSSTIADISSYIKDCSVKTIQRILGELAEEGRIERRGNKRWTTYHII